MPLRNGPHPSPACSNPIPRAKPNATVSQTIGVTKVKIASGRPSVRGRDFSGGLVPLGEEWRPDANGATTISFTIPVRVEGKPLNTGSYGSFTILGPNQWPLVFNETADQWNETLPWISRSVEFKKAQKMGKAPSGISELQDQIET